LFGTVKRTLDESDLEEEVVEADIVMNGKKNWIRESIEALILYRNTEYLALKACPSSECLFSIYRDYIEYKITSNF
jgi:hypothetical protein